MAGRAGSVRHEDMIRRQSRVMAADHGGVGRLNSPVKHSVLNKGVAVLFAVAAQAFDIEDGHATIFEPEKPLFFQPLQALVGVLPGDA